MSTAAMPSNEARTLPWPTRVTVVDVTPRDGLQDADAIISAREKLALISRLLDAGVTSIEATSFMHPKWIPQLADADEVAQALPRREGVTYSALVPNLRGYERARAARMDEVTLVVSASDAHNRANLNRTTEQTLELLAEVARHAREDGIPLRGAVATSFGCPFTGAVPAEDVLRVVRAYREMGVAQVSLADSIGTGQPRQVYDLFLAVRRELPEHISLGAHFHDRARYGLANVFAALLAGVGTLDAALGGLGGCPYAPGAPGNMDTETLVEYLHTMGIETGISLAGLATARAAVLDDVAHGAPVTTGHSLRNAHS